MKNVLKNLAVVVTLVLTSNVTALAAPLNEKFQQQKDSLAKIQTQRDAVEMKVEEFDNEIEKIMTKTEDNKGKMAQTEKSIESATLKIKKVKSDTQEEQKLYNSRMRIMYMNGSEGYMSIILDSESFGEIGRAHV